MRHCWGDRHEIEGRDRADGEPDWVCLLPADHDGPHEWTDPENLIVEFKPPND